MNDELQATQKQLWELTQKLAELRKKHARTGA